MLRRLFSACLLRPEDVPPSDDALEVVATFNPGAIALDGEVVLLIRVAERPKEQREGMTALPRWDAATGLNIDWEPNDALRFVDPRVVEVKETGVIRLTFISHLICARSKDGRSIDSIGATAFTPHTDYETYGVEDPRLTRFDDRIYFTYVAVSRHGACTALASTKDFQTFERHGIIFAAENKDVVLFPSKIGGQYAAFHRPSPAMLFAPPEMWIAYSPDLLHWGRHEPFHGGSSQWETGRIGGGCPPIQVDEGWLEIYHGNERTAGGIGAYSAGALLLDIANPQRVLRRSLSPIMMPEADFERTGFVNNVVFPTGIVERGDILQVYYGAADANVGVVEWSKQELVDSLA